MNLKNLSAHCRKMEKCCRVCLNTNSLEYIDFETIFDEVSELTYRDCFQKCTRLDLLTNSICLRCGSDLKIAYDFLQKAEKADRILRQAAEFGNELDEVEQTQYLEELEEMSEDQQYEQGQIVFEHSTSNLGALVTTEMEYNDSSNGSRAEELLEETTQLEILEFNYDDFDDRVGGILEITEENEKTTTAMQEEEALEECLKSELSTTTFACAACSNTFDTHTELMQHNWKVHKAAVVTTCKICHQEVSNKSGGMRKHLQEVHSAIVQCSKCNFKGKESRLPEHERRLHAEQRDFLCNVCSKTFVSSGLLNAHLKKHDRKKSNTKSDACEVCGKQFSTQHYLRLHMEVHREERERHQCIQCDKIYFSKMSLENHMRVHNGENVVQCPWCGKIFARPYELKVHKRFHTRDYPFECEVCQKKFAIKGHLRTHMWRHQGLKLQCEECGKLFTSTKALTEHSYSHTQMPFSCSYCPKGYPSKQKYKMHLKTIHLIDLTEEELQKTSKAAPTPLLRKKLTLVQADNVMREVEIKIKEEYDDGSGGVEVSGVLE